MTPSQFPCARAPVRQSFTMTDIERLTRMIDDLRRMREQQCEPKSNANPRYLRYSNAVSALRWVIDDHESDEPYVCIGLTVGIVRANNSEDAAAAAAFAAAQDVSHLLFIRSGDALDLAAPLRRNLEKLLAEHGFQAAIVTSNPPPSATG